jgi:membrane peptidoglycan carboxypeptidase
MISPNMATALTTTEDPGFMYHRGIIPQAIENSLKDNLKLGKFFRGGSTLTMQLAKNLWLSRTRTLGRKLQEAILTVALESALPKDKILELYLNVVEYGPNLYGIGPASKELLHKDPLELTLTDAMYLVLRLPAPNRSASYERMKGMISKLLDNALKAGKVTEDMVEVEKGQLTPVNMDDDD